MYFDAQTIVLILNDADAAALAAPAIAATPRRFTSPLAVVEAILTAGPADDGTTADQRVLNFLDAAGIEIRDMPPSHRMIEAAALADAADADLIDLLNRVSADYYEAAVFVLPDASAEPEVPAAPAEQTDPTKG